METGVPLYLDWSFWTALVAGLALILSQLPPLYELLRPGKLSLEVYSRILIQHKVGNPNLQLHIMLTNTGGRRVSVKQITVILRQNQRDISVLPAQTYLLAPNDKGDVLLTSFSIDPKREWAHFVKFFKYFDRAVEKKYRAAELAHRTEVIEKRKLPENKDIAVEVDSRLVKPFEEMFDELFIWQPGEYEVQVTVESAAKKALARRKYRFTLFESDSTNLSAVKNAFKFGDGISWDSGDHPGVVVQIVEV